MPTLSKKIFLPSPAFFYRDTFVVHVKQKEADRLRKSDSRLPFDYLSVLLFFILRVLRRVEYPVKRRARYAHFLCNTGFVALILHHKLFGHFQTLFGEEIAHYPQLRAILLDFRNRLFFLEHAYALRKILPLYLIGFAYDHAVFHAVAQLAHIAGPAV